MGELCSVKVDVLAEFCNSLDYEYTIISIIRLKFVFSFQLSCIFVFSNRKFIQYTLFIQLNICTWICKNIVPITRFVKIIH